MDNILFSIGNIVIFKSALIMVLGIAICAIMSAWLYRRETGSADGVIWFLPVAFILSAFFSRILHWYFTGYAYDSFIQAFTDHTVGGFAMAGVIIGVWLAAFIMGRVGLCPDPGRLLDCVSPGLCIFVISQRLGCFFTGSCIGNKNIEAKLFQWAPLSVAVTDNAGNVDYRLRVYFIEIVLVAILAAVLLLSFRRLMNTGVRRPCKPYGNLSKWFLVIFCCIEVLTDSLRNDSILMRFRFLHQMNPYSSFISLAQIFSLIVLLCVFGYYLSCAVRIYGFRKRHAFAIVSIVLSLLLMGLTGEFCIQRFGMVRFILTVRTWGYISMLIGIAGVIKTISGLYRSCVLPAYPDML